MVIWWCDAGFHMMFIAQHEFAYELSHAMARNLSLRILTRTWHIPMRSEKWVHHGTWQPEKWVPKRIFVLGMAQTVGSYKLVRAWCFNRQVSLLSFIDVCSSFSAEDRFQTPQKLWPRRVDARCGRLGRRWSRSPGAMFELQGAPTGRRGVLRCA